ncbi:MAG: hypothetical protein K6G72_05270 [Lachnospiraceae bacterium]|nr:hypothetical protein [Lachnospiraceae bacterium]
MKKKKLYLFLAIEAIIIALVIVVTRNSYDNTASLVSFPFGLIGDGLRRLSLRGGALNVLSFVIYSVICISPIAGLFMYSKEVKAFPEKLALCFLSPVLFYCLYEIINPTYLGLKLLADKPASAPIMSLTIDSFVLLYLILRLVRVLRSSDKEGLYRYLRIFMGALSFVAVAALVITVVKDFIFKLSEAESRLDVTALILKTVLDAAVLLLTLLISLQVIKLTDVLQDDCAGLAPVSKKLCTLCCVSLIFSTLSSVVMNGFNALFISRLNNMNATLSIPVYEIIFSLITLLLTRLLIENKDLREENELII